MAEALDALTKVMLQKVDTDFHPTYLGLRLFDVWLCVVVCGCV